MLAYLIQMIFALIPDTRFWMLKSRLLRLRGFQVGENVRVVSSVKFKTKHLSIGENTFIGHNVFISGGDSRIEIGANVDIAPCCVIVAGTHKIGDSRRRAGEGYSEKIVIGKGVWIGASTTILGGVTIGNGSIIGAASLVRKDVEPNYLVAGNPAAMIRKLD